jgi:hypothetical protein
MQASGPRSLPLLVQGIFEARARRRGHTHGIRIGHLPVTAPDRSPEQHADEHRDSHPHCQRDGDPGDPGPHVNAPRSDVHSLSAILD